MSRHHGIGTVLLVVGIMVLGLGWTSTASAKGKTPPSIDDLVGVYQVTDKGIDYDLWSTDTGKYSNKGTCAITKLDPETINMHFETEGGWIWDDVCYYGGGGVVVTGSSDDDELGSWGYLSWMTFSGKPGKLKAKGMYMQYDLNEGWLDVASLPMKQAS